MNAGTNTNIMVKTNTINVLTNISFKGSSTLGYKDAKIFAVFYCYVSSGDDMFIIEFGITLAREYR